MRSLFARRQRLGSVAADRSRMMSRVDRRFLFALGLLFFAIQTLLLLPDLQSFIPHYPTAQLRAPSVSTLDYTEYRSTFSCLPTRSEDTCAIRAKYILKQDADVQGAFGVLVADYSGNLQFWVNGQPVEEQGSKSVVQRLGFGVPIFVRLPDALLQSGDNSVEVIVSSDLPFGALIHRVYIGKESVVRDLYSSAYVKKWTIPRLIEGMLMATWIFAAYVVLRHKLAEYNSAFLFLTLICLSTIANYFVDSSSSFELRVLPMFLRLSAGTVVGEILAQNKDGKPFVSLKYLLLVPLVSILAMLQCDGSFEFLFVFELFWAFLIAFSIVGLGVKIRNAITDKDYYEVFPIGITIVGMSISSSNLLAVFGYLNSTMISARGYVVIALVLIVAMKIFSTFSRYLERVKAANEILSAEVERVRQELALVYFKDNALKQQMTVQLERERLMGDLHDGLAGNLISISALADHGKPAVLAEIRRLSKIALLDLRLVVDSLDTFDGDLAVALAAFKERITPLYSGTRTKISWDTDFAPLISKLGPEVNLAIFRILQEAIANAVRHGGATRVHILVRESKCRNATASIWVLDNGTAPGEFAPGFGMRNMRRRAEKIYGNVYFRLHKDGSAILLNI